MSESAITITNTTKEGKKLSATFLPSKGMNFISYKCGDIEVIDQSTKGLFEERYAGLGAMIGPHFHHRKVIPEVKDESLFPHIGKVKAKGVKEPFSHGIGRYAPWKVVEKSEDRIVATLSGKEKWNKISLSELEGEDFEMRYEAVMLPEGLSITLKAECAHNCVVGLHTYYATNANASVISHVQDCYRNKEKILPLPCPLDSDGKMVYAVNQETDFGFFPQDPLRGKIRLDNGNYQVCVSYESPNDENSWQLWHPLNASFVCIEPLSAKDPRNPSSKTAEIAILIAVNIPMNEAPWKK